MEKVSPNSTKEVKDEIEMFDLKHQLYKRHATFTEERRRIDVDTRKAGVKLTAEEELLDPLYNDGEREKHGFFFGAFKWVQATGEYHAPSDDQRMADITNVPKNTRRTIVQRVKIGSFSKVRFALCLFYALVMWNAYSHFHILTDHSVRELLTCEQRGDCALQYVEQFKDIRNNSYIKQFGRAVVKFTKLNWNIAWSATRFVYHWSRLRPMDWYGPRASVIRNYAAVNGMSEGKAWSLLKNNETWYDHAFYTTGLLQRVTRWWYGVDLQKTSAARTFIGDVVLNATRAWEKVSFDDVTIAKPFMVALAMELMLCWWWTRVYHIAPYLLDNLKMDALCATPELTDKNAPYILRRVFNCDCGSQVNQKVFSDTIKFYRRCLVEGMVFHAWTPAMRPESRVNPFLGFTV